MIKEIIKLQEVQAIDLRIFALKKLQKELPENLLGMQNDIKSKQAVLLTLNNELKELKAHQKNLEIEIQGLKETTTKYKNQLLLLKSNEQYKALLSEIKHAEDKSTQIEDQVLTIMMGIDDKLKEIAGAEEKLKQSERNLQEQENDIKAEIARVDDEIKKMRDKRGALTDTIDPKALSIYERLLKNKGESKAMVAVVDNICQGCFMKLPPNDVLKVRKGHEIQKCENCARILFWPHNDEE